MTLLHQYTNGNAEIKLYSNGTRVIDYDDATGLQLDWPLNIDIRVSTRCAFGLNPATKKSVCSFCHESARTDGDECDYVALAEVLAPLPAGVELAIGMNQYTPELREFLEVCKDRGHVCNVTVNQGLLPQNETQLKALLDANLVKGIGVSYRRGFRAIPKWLLDYENTVVHVIAGIDTVHEVMALSELGVKKVLVLGEKDFGFNLGRVDVSSQNHFEWTCHIPSLLQKFDVVSFDNLALEQLKPQRFFREDVWRPLFQGEYSFYINAVDKTFSPSSRSPKNVPYGCISEYFSKAIMLK